jgi:hypothetical protein
MLRTIKNMIITKSHEEKIEGTLFCYDRININCTAGTFGYADGMKNFFYTKAGYAHNPSLNYI